MLGWAMPSAAQATTPVAAPTTQDATTATAPVAQDATTATATAPVAQDATQDTAAQGDDGEIVVTGFRASLAKGIELKRESVAVRDSIVAEDIGKFPEANIADSLQRIPGVALSRDGASNEGQRISIRGLSSEYNVTTINGAPVRTTSSQNVGTSTRDFNFDVFPSELFGRVDVYKSPLANLEEGGIGGNVDLQTPRPFDGRGGFSLRYQAAGNYNTQSKKWGPRGSLIASNTWGNVGVLFGVAYAKNVNERSGFQSTGGYNSSVLGSRAYATPPLPNGGPFNFQLDLDNPNARFGSLTRAQVANGLLPRFFRVFTSNNERERLGFVGSLQYKGDRLELSVDGIYSKLKDTADEFTFGVAVRNTRTVAGTTNLPGRGTNSGLIPVDVKLDQYNNMYGTFDNASFLGESFYRDADTEFKYGIVRGVYEIADNLKFSAQANMSESAAEYSANRILYNIYSVRATFDPTQDVTYPTISSPVDFTNPANYADPSLGFSLSRETDKQRTARAVLDWQVVDQEGERFGILLGGSYVKTTKSISLQDGSSIASTRTLPGGGTFATSTQANIFANMTRGIQYGSINDGGNSGYPSNFATFSRAYVIDTLGANSANMAAPVRLNAAFTADEIVKSAFLEANFETGILGSPLRGNMGVRYSDTRTIINNFGASGGGNFAPQRREGGYENFLPSASLAFDITPKLLLRGSIGRTITRAALSNIAASTLVPSIFDPVVTVGNPNLEPQQASQIDAGVEWYFSPGGLLSVGVFEKSLTGVPISVQETVPFSAVGLPSSAFNALSIGFPSGTIDPNTPFIRRTFANSGRQKLKGLEIAYQQGFTFLPGFLDGLGLTSNFTIIDRAGLDFVTSEGRAISVAPVPDYSFSVTPYYEKGPFSLRASYNYRARTGPATNQNTGNDQIPYTAPQGFLDATVSYRISKAFELRVDALNITNENVYIYYDDPDQPRGNELTRRDNSYFNGTTISFGIRGSF